jgi:squalene cyclase
MNFNEVRAAVLKAQRVLAQTQQADGSWSWPCDAGAFITAQALVALKFVGRLSPEDARDGARFLQSQQLPDGSFGGGPFSQSGDLGATASAWAAFHACGVPEAEAKARAWVEAHGGVAGVIARIAEGDLAAMFLAMEKLADPTAIPAPPLLLTLIPPVEKLLEKRFNTGVLMMLSQNAALVRHLRGDWGEHGDERGWFDSLECRRALELIQLYQNPDGSWDSNLIQQVMSVPALKALGVSDERLTRAVDWLLQQRVRDASGLWFVSFNSTVWTTALALRALVNSGVPPSDERVRRALEYLLGAQIQVPMPLPSQPRPGAPRSGGWAFECAGNVTMPDCDDTGVVLGALGRVLAQSGLEPALEGRTRLACAAGRDWLLGMQGEDGGWGSFQAGMPGKPPGPMMDKPLVIPMHDPLALAKLFLDPPVLLGDPSTEDVTSRILYGLGQLGYTRTAPEVANALAFLRQQQCENGGWWGRWVVNYHPTTACALLAFAAVDADLQSDPVRRAVSFLVEHQNEDGGWGEGAHTYADPSRAGTGPSMPPLTGLVLSALIAVGHGGSEAVRRGVGYLVSTQRSDGTWPNADWLHAYMPPQYFYYLPGETRHYPLEALGCYLALQEEASRGLEELATGDGEEPATTLPEIPSRLPGGDWNPDFLSAMRSIGDTLGDSVIAEIFATGTDAVNDLLAKITRSDDPIPPGLPARAVAYFDETSALPPWADSEQIAIAEQMFVRTGWAVATGLFCSSLPQAYAAANGARVLMGTGGMTFHVERRVFETAQFIFDVLDRGAVGPVGRGLRAAQKVRLLHAAIRHLTLRQPGWNLAWGVPLNQEDLVGTLMTFSCVVLDALTRLHVPFSNEEGEAFIHHWKVVGHVMGIDRRLLPRDRHDGDRLMEQIRSSQWSHSPQGVALAAALVKMQQRFLPTSLLDDVPIAVMRDLAGDHCADLLSLPRANWTRHIVDFAMRFDGLPGIPVGEKLRAEVSHYLLEGLVNAFREGKQVKFRIPNALVHAWNLKD